MTEIRLIEPPEAERLSAFLWQTFSDTYAHAGSAVALAQLRARAYQPAMQLAELDCPQLESWVLIDHGEWAGVAQVQSEGEPHPAVAVRPVQSINRFYFDRAFHGKQLAHRLMNHVVERAGVKSIAGLWLSAWKQAEQALRFYRKHGFEAVGETAFMYGDEPKDDWVMLKRL
jgi:ribosomal protein S18 acetylase RimI-like enzyme